MSVGLRGQPVAENGGRDTGHRFTEAFAALSSSHCLAAHGAGVGEVEVLNNDGVDAVAQGVVDEPGDRVPDLGIAAGAGAGKVEVDARWCTDRVPVRVESSHGKVSVVEVHGQHRAIRTAGWKRPSGAQRRMRQWSLPPRGR